MVRHPNVAKKAQAEMDRVLGYEQLPTLKDRQDLPFIDCILKETMRCVAFYGCIRYSFTTCLFRFNLPNPLGEHSASYILAQLYIAPGVTQVFRTHRWKKMSTKTGLFRPVLSSSTISGRTKIYLKFLRASLIVFQGDDAWRAVLSGCRRLQSRPLHYEDERIREWQHSTTEDI